MSKGSDESVNSFSSYVELLKFINTFLNNLAIFSMTENPKIQKN